MVSRHETMFLFILSVIRSSFFRSYPPQEYLVLGPCLRLAMHLTAHLQGCVSAAFTSSYLSLYYLYNFVRPPKYQLNQTKIALQVGLDPQLLLL